MSGGRVTLAAGRACSVATALSTCWLTLRWHAIRAADSQLRRSGEAGDLGPNLKGLGPGGSILVGWNSMAAEQQEVVDAVMGGEEALCLAGRLEALHQPFSPSRGLV